MTEPLSGSADAAADALRKAGIDRAELLVVFGSGQRNPWRREAGLTLSYGDIPGWAAPDVTGHRGELSLVTIGRENVLVMVGRHHYYEARSYDSIAMPLETARALGVERVLLTNSSGAVREDLRPGDFVLISDHILLHGPELPDRLRAGWPEGTPPGYWQEGAAIVRRGAERIGLQLAEGVLLCVTGPSYETPAEIEMARRMGAAVVAMSLAPEALIAGSLGLDVAGLSLVSNLAGTAGSAGLQHQDVLEAAAGMQADLDRLMREAAPRLLPSSGREDPVSEG